MAQDKKQDKKKARESAKGAGLQAVKIVPRRKAAPTKGQIVFPTSIQETALTVNAVAFLVDNLPGGFQKSKFYNHKVQEFASQHGWIPPKELLDEEQK